MLVKLDIAFSEGKGVALELNANADGSTFVRVGPKNESGILLSPSDVARLADFLADIVEHGRPKIVGGGR